MFHAETFSSDNGTLEEKGNRTLKTQRRFFYSERIKIKINQYQSCLSPEKKVFLSEVSGGERE